MDYSKREQGSPLFPMSELVKHNGHFNCSSVRAQDASELNTVFTTKMGLGGF